MTNKLDCLKLINFIEKSNLFTTNKIRDKKLLIAFSGGQDSSCLLTIFYILSKKWGFKLGAVYCNHCWTDSPQSSLSAFDTLQMFDIPFYFVESPNSEPMKPEQKARDWRYSSFYTISKWEDYDFVLTGHSLSDCVETVLFNLFRGSGLKGICSLKEDQKFSNLKTNDFFFQKTVCFLDPFFYFSDKKGNPFFRKYRLFQSMSFLSIFPKFDFFAFGENCAIDKSNFPLKNKSKGKNLQFLTSFDIKNWFGIKKICRFCFLDKIGQTGIKKKRGTNRVPILIFSRRVNKTTSPLALNFQTKNKRVDRKSFLFRFSLAFALPLAFALRAKGEKVRKNALLNQIKPVSFFFKTKKDKTETNLFHRYLQTIKKLQNRDKISSFITIFRPFILTLGNVKIKGKKIKNKNLPFQIKKLIRKKEKEKGILWNSLSKLDNKDKLISNQIQKKGFKLIPKFILTKDKKSFSNFPPFIFDQLEKTFRKEKVDTKPRNSSPQFEVLFNKLSQPSSDKKNVDFIVFRPLIKITRETLFLFSNNLKIPIYYDKSNKDLNITRNYIRKVLVPLLKKINPRVEENIYKFSKIIEFYYQVFGDLKCPSDRFDIFNP
uniref:tRNA(Ile)-lysidine synthase, chloroplastic n=1 Tax=Tupiella akineta TaxID=160070 RepID=TILS_TUPAK|nr:hypothetical protein RF62 [Tupiella akineta]Q3ZJ89.1 RecName: Full=tRNA(Ile)-lysidine synthase, chloroplastic; AltName: Full=tRNA(Ile)-2-lysyl-cytidine synthase; AltName: Full=tRNA(Ile)-lysidine synthetase [Tupiella akineta]AAV80602.1 hypothetical protein RF62 [Tupiella akineta]